MKRYLLLFLVFLLMSGQSFGASFKDYKTHAYPFVGKWNPSDDPLVIDNYGLQDIQNLRSDGKRLRGVSGHTRTTSGATNNTYKYLRNLYHFKKDRPDESHVIVLADDGTGWSTESRLYQNTTTIPNVGDYSTTVLHTNPNNCEVGRFSPAPRGNMLYNNASESMIWGGDEMPISAFIASTAAITDSITNPRDFTKEVNNDQSDAGNVATISSSDYQYFVVGFTRPLNGIYFTISSGATGATLTVKEWDGAWTALSVTDHTSGMNTSGWVLWSSTVSTSKPKYLDGSILYWYQFEIDTSSVDISNVTVSAPFQAVKNIWDGAGANIFRCFVHDGTSYTDYSDHAAADDKNFVVDVGGMGSDWALFLGFVQRMQGLEIKFPAGKENEAAASLSVYYSDGSTWTAVDNLRDSTVANSASFGQTGHILWDKIGEGSEYHQMISDDTPLYYYKLQWDATLTGGSGCETTCETDCVGEENEWECKLGCEDQCEYGPQSIKGIINTEDIDGYRFGVMYQGRAFLCSETEGEQNKCLYSAFNAPDVWNGSDSGPIYFGDYTKVTAAAVIYNLFQSAGFEQMIVTKSHETYRVFGDGPTNWQVQRMSANVGCISPLSMAVCEVAPIGQNERHVAVWQTDFGVVMCDGAAIIPISEDIRCYWDANDSRAIPADRIDDSVGWYDSNLSSYKLLISSGSGQTTHNVELEYSFKYNEWTKLYRENADGANPLQCGGQVRDSHGNTYSYAGTDEGHVYRTENGNNWQGTDIAQFLKTKAILVDSDRPYFAHTNIKYVRLTFEDKAGSTDSKIKTEGGDFITTESGDSLLYTRGETITIEHWCDGTQSVNDSNNQQLPAAININDGPAYAEGCQLGPCLMHTFKFSGDFTTIADGLEITGFGMVYTPWQRLMTDD